MTMVKASEDGYVPGLAGVPVTKSEISDIDGHRGILKLRGYAIEELAEKSTYEETAYLVLKGELPSRQELDQFKSELAAHRAVEPGIIEMMKAYPKNAHPMSALQTSIASMALFYPRTVDDEEVNHQACCRLIAQVPTLVAAFHNIRQGKEPVAPREDLSCSANFLYMLHGEAPPPLVERTFDVCLILHVEHTVNASTFTAMVTSSTLADPYGTIAAAVASLGGPLHGGANERVLQMLEEIGSVERVEAVINEKIARKEVIYGMGHREYKTMDPRARILKSLVKPLFEEFGPTPLYDIAVEVEKVATARLGERGIWPNVDFYSGIVYDRMGIPIDLFTPVFAVSRIAGWVAHWREQIANNRLFRPTQIYQGHGDRAYVPLELRG
ncbi:MAG: citrate synthase [Dehalococcoidia bacterium]|nr:citrate synthase [Dehalococcoidia bacterium]